MTTSCARHPGGNNKKHVDRRSASLLRVVAYCGVDVGEVVRAVAARKINHCIFLPLPIVILSAAIIVDAWPTAAGRRGRIVAAAATPAALRRHRVLHAATTARRDGTIE